MVRGIRLDRLLSFLAVGFTRRGAVVELHPIMCGIAE
jgi:hypothetical protein